MENNKDFFFDINLINDVIDGTVDEKTATEFFEHIKDCSSCRKAYEEALKIKEIMKQDGFLPGTEKLPGEEFTARTMDKIRKAKKPAVIRIMRLPAVKAALAAAACLIIAVFVFRSDLFGRIEGINGLAADSIGNESAQNGIEAPAAPDYETAANSYGQDLSEDNYTSGSDMSIPETSYYAEYDNEYQPEEPASEEERNVTNTKNAYDPNNGAYDNKPQSDSSGAVSEYTEPPVSSASSSEIMTVIPEDEPAETETANQAPEPAPMPSETEPTISSCEIYPEAPSAAAEPPIEEQDDGSDEFPEDEPEQIFEEPACLEEESPSADPSGPYDGFALTYPSYQVPLNENDNETALKASSVIAGKAVLEGCQKIIACFKDVSEEIDWNSINEMYPGRFVYVGSAEYDGYKYEAYTCEVYYGENDYVYDLFSSAAFEVTPAGMGATDGNGTYSYFILIRVK